jgi:hypothetical protein
MNETFLRRTKQGPCHKFDPNKNNDLQIRPNKIYEQNLNVS